MRVALVGDYPPRSDRIGGGPQAVFSYLLEGLKQIEELELYVVSAQKTVSAETVFLRDGVHFYFLVHPHLPMELAFLPLRHRIRQTLRRIKPDIVHVQAGDIYGSICTGMPYPMLSTMHNVPVTEPRFMQTWVSRIRMAIHDSWTNAHFLRNARHIVSISEHINRGVAPRTQAKLYSIPNPIADSFFDLPIGRTVPRRLLFVGNLRRIKRPDLALEALALARMQVPDLTLRMAGNVPNLVGKQLSDIIERHNLGDSVQILGHLCQEQLLKEYQQAEILLLTSELETSPMAIQQAMAAGKAVVATSVGGVPDLVQDEYTGLLAESGNATSIAQGLIRVALNDVLRMQLGREARAYARTHFRARSVAYRTYEVYKHILADRSVS
jgi:glycosyltransferase involved in cell wall biosynthesis